MIIAGWIVFTAYAILLIFFAIRGARNTKSMADYAVGSFIFSPLAVGLSLAASMTSAATFIINPGFVAYYGLSAFISFGLVVPFAALVSLVILTKGYQKTGSTVKALTMAQWIGKRYGSERFALFFGFLSLLLLTFIVLIVVGLSKVISTTLLVNEIWVAVIIVIFIFGYMMFGGANSMVYTNTIQASLMLIVAIILIGSGYQYFSSGWTGFWKHLSAIDPNLVSVPYPESPLFRDYFEIIFAQVVIGIAIVCQPHIITKSLLLKKESDINKFLVSGIIVQMLFFFVIFAGLFARLQFPDLQVDGNPIALDSVMSEYVVSRFGVLVGILVVMGLVSAGMSTLEGLIQSLSTTITQDIIGHTFRDRLQHLVSDMVLNRIVIGLLALVTIGVSVQQLVNPNLSVAILAQNGVYAYFSAAFIPVLFGTFFSQVDLRTPVYASLVAVLVHFSVYYGKLSFYTSGLVPNPGVAAAYAILAASATGVILHFLVFRNSSEMD